MSVTLVINVQVAGGSVSPSSWVVAATGPATISGTGTAGGTVPAGVYTLSEGAGPSGYTPSAWTMTGVGGILLGNILTVVDGASVIITVTNVFILSAVIARPTLRYEIPRRGWFALRYANPMAYHYLDEPSVNQPNDMQLLQLSGSSVVKAGGDTDSSLIASGPIQVSVQLPSYDGGDERAQKLFVDTMTDADQSGTITEQIQFNNMQVAGPSVALATVATRQQLLANISSVGVLALYRNISARFTWTGGPSGPRLYAWEPSGYAQPYLSKRIVTQFGILGFQGWKHHRRIYAGLISNGEVDFTIQAQDGRTFGPYVIPSTAGQFKVVPLIVEAGCKDLSFAYQLEETDGQEFALFPEAFTVEVKQWTQPEYIELAVFEV